ncbi:MAG: tetratricopeptide repeat protein [Saprospiraceae bacterium]|nr:tetratricopeptide repeat protein [Saprospiraceae bacterium]
MLKLCKFLRSNAGGKLDGDHLKVLLNKDATAAQFAIALDWLWEVVKEGDQVIIYFSGHGDVEKKSLTQPGYLLCWDAPSRVYLAGRALALPMFQDVISTLSVQNKAKVIVITDACRSGKLAGSTVGGSQITGANLAKQYANEIKILSCQPHEYSIEGEQWGGGRGAFSYNLVNALYGMADHNKDLIVNLQETGRYLEDHVTSEVAPVSQVPMVLGNRSEQLAKVDVSLLALIRSGKTNQLASISTIDSRGMEEDVLAKLDTNILEKYKLFKNAMLKKQLLEPVHASADHYYTELIKLAELSKLHSTMTRNFAAALQDDAQQAMNIWLKADVKELQCIGKTLKLEPIPRQLQRAAELLGEQHYMYRSLQARTLLFEGIVLSKRNNNPDEKLGRQCIQFFRESLAKEPQSPLPWSSMSREYATHLRIVDSAFLCAYEARLLAPNWVSPYVNLANLFSYQANFDAAETALREAAKMDSLHPLVIKERGFWHSKQHGEEHKKAALTLFENYQKSGGVLYPCWHVDYANVLASFGKMDAAEAEFRKAIELDSTNASAWANFGSFLYFNLRLNESEKVLRRAGDMDSTIYAVWMLLGQVYGQQGRFAESESVMLKALRLDSTIYGIWTALGILYYISGRHDDAERYLKKSHALYPSDPWTLNYLGELAANRGRWEEAGIQFKKSIGLDSSFVRGWNGWAGVLVATKQFAEAERAALVAIALDSTWTESHRHLGMAYFKTGRQAQAKTYFEKSLKIVPEYFPAQLGLTYILLSEGKNSEALTQLEQAIGKGCTYEQLKQDEDLGILRSLPEWNVLMQKHFPEKVKE